MAGADAGPGTVWIVKQPVELISERILPTLRGLVVRRLLRDHGMKQTDVAEAMGLTQAAVSHYKNATRGRDPEVLERLPELRDHAEVLADQVAGGASQPEQVAYISEVCRQIQSSDGFCHFHLETSRYEGTCNVCFEAEPNVQFLRT